MKEKALAIIHILKQRYPEAPCALQYKKDYELMIAVRLSADGAGSQGEIQQCEMR